MIHSTVRELWELRESLHEDVIDAHSKDFILSCHDCSTCVPGSLLEFCRLNVKVKTTDTPREF